VVKQVTKYLKKIEEIVESKGYEEIVSNIQDFLKEAKKIMTVHDILESILNHS